MKKQLLKIAYRGILLFSMVTFGLSSSAFNYPTKEIKADQPISKAASIDYAGISNGTLQFNVKYENPEGSKFYITIKNMDGDIFYTEKFSGKNFNTTIALVKEPGNARLTFSIVAAHHYNYDQVFDIQSDSKWVEQVSVIPGK